jgi:hypothetical protein
LSVRSPPHCRSRRAHSLLERVVHCIALLHPGLINTILLSVSPYYLSLTPSGTVVRSTSQAFRHRVQLQSAVLAACVPSVFRPLSSSGQGLVLPVLPCLEILISTGPCFANQLPDSEPSSDQVRAFCLANLNLFSRFGVHDHYQPNNLIPLLLLTQSSLPGLLHLPSHRTASSITLTLYLRLPFQNRSLGSPLVLWKVFVIRVLHLPPSCSSSGSLLDTNFGTWRGSHWISSAPSGRHCACSWRARLEVV